MRNDKQKEKLPHAQQEVSVQVRQVKFVEPNFQLAVVEGHVVVSPTDEDRTEFDAIDGGSTATAIGFVKNGEPCNLIVRGHGNVKKLDQYLSDIYQEDNNRHQKSTGKWISCAAPENEDCHLIRVVAEMTLKIERNRRGTKMLTVEEILAIGTWGTMNQSQISTHSATRTETSSIFCMYDKSHRHDLFANWLIDKYGSDFLGRGGGVLDVAGGKGELALALLQRGIPSVVLLDPNPRIYHTDTAGKETAKLYTNIHVIAHALEGNGLDLLVGPSSNNHSATSKSISPEERKLLQACSIIVGMHPDQATEPIVYLSAHMNVPFAMLPCCVMPSLFPNRRYSGQPVRSYRVFCEYLQNLNITPCNGGNHNKWDKTRQMQKSKIQVDYLPFMGRNMILYTTTTTTA